jgi:hypothetical protein
MSAGGIFGIFLFVMILITSVGSGVLYILHKQKIIDVYIPHEMRIMCLKGYLTRQETKAFGHQRKMMQQLSNNRELMLHMQVKTVAGEGFILKDSFFSDHYEDAGFENADYDPNFGFRDPGAVKPHVFRKPGLSIDDSPEEDDVGEVVSSEPDGE